MRSCVACDGRRVALAASLGSGLGPWLLRHGLGWRESATSTSLQATCYRLQAAGRTQRRRAPSGEECWGLNFKLLIGRVGLEHLSASLASRQLVRSPPLCRTWFPVAEFQHVSLKSRLVRIRGLQSAEGSKLNGQPGPQKAAGTCTDNVG